MQIFNGNSIIIIISQLFKKYNYFYSNLLRIAFCNSKLQKKEFTTDYK